MLGKIYYKDSQDHYIHLGSGAIVVFLLVVVVLATAIFGGVVRASTGSWADSITSFFSHPSSSGSTIVEPVKVVSEESQVVDVVKRSTPAVVSIIATAEVPKLEQCYPQSSSDEGLSPDMQNFFGGPMLCQNGTQTERIGAGSGFLVSSDGYILTNRHVVEDEKAEYTVVLNDENHAGKKLPAKVLARDTVNDVAVLKINVDNVPYVSFGDSSKVQVGQTAIAIGYALGEFDNTVSKGVVSGLSRTIEAGGLESGNAEQLRGLIQTDAAINPGNSGGPLLDIDGNVMGMNVAVAEAQGIGFAIPINTVKKDFDEVKTSGKIVQPEKAFIGVRYEPVTPEVQGTKKLPYSYGMLLIPGDTDKEPAVVPNSPADKAHLKEGDVILKVDDKELNERYTLTDALFEHKPGDTVQLQVFRDGKVSTIPVTLDKAS